MKRVLAGLAAGAMWLWAAMPAAAQPTFDELTDDQMSELYCVYDYLDLFVGAPKITEVYTTNDPGTAAFVEADADVKEASDMCAEEYGWEGDGATLMTVIGLYTMMGDQLEVNLGDQGIDEEGLDAIYGVADVLSDDDIGAFADGTWLGNEAIHQRVTDGLAKAGVGGEAVIRNALFLMEAYVIASLSVEHWLSGLTDS